MVKTSKITVLVVEDNPANMNYLLYLLKKLDFETIPYTNGEEALSKTGNSVDIMLLDINLGEGMSGLDLMTEFRKRDHFNDIPIVAVTAYYSGGLHEELLKKGFTDYLAKPYQFEELKDVLKKNIEL